MKNDLLIMIRRYLLAGLLIWMPILVTIFVIHFIVSLLDGTVALLPKDLRPDSWLGLNIPGFGVVLSLLILFFTGMLATNFLGKKLVAFWDAAIDRIPIIRSVYTGVKQVMHTLVSPGGNAFRRVLLVEYPRKGMWSIAFQTGETNEKIAEQTQQDLVTIFIPTTPNPTSGFLMMVPKEDAIVLNMSVDQALKFVISLGVVQPHMLPVSAKPEVP